MKRVTKKESSIARRKANELLKQFKNKLKDKYKFSCRIVGSATWNIITKNKDGFWDVDYQILLTKNSKEYKDNKLSNPTQIKEDFFNILNNKYKNDKTKKVENSTTAITYIDSNNKFSIDFVIIKLFPDNHEIIRRNNKAQSSINEYTWNELKKHNEAYDFFSKLNPKEKENLIEDYILPHKIKEKEKNDGDPSKKSSCEVFIEEVNNYEYRKGNKRLYRK